MPWVRFTAPPYAVDGCYRLSEDEAERWIDLGVAVQIAEPAAPAEPAAARPMFKLQIDEGLVVVKPGSETIENT